MATTAPAAAQAATQQDVLPSGGMVLLGTMGAEGAKSALVRMSNGTTERVEPGDTVARFTVTAVAEGRLYLQRKGETTVLGVPQG
ncbi:MAG: hypothetical protein AAFO93_07085 [Pseudomonadota bacterium]